MSEEYRKWSEENRKSLQEIDKRMEEINKLVKEADEFENVDFESFEYRTEKENAIYEKTKEFGRTQFVREISFQISENKKLRDRELIITMELDKLQKENEQLRLMLGNQIRIKGELSKENKELHDKIDKAIEYIEKFSDPSIGAIKKILKDSDVDE